MNDEMPRDHLRRELRQAAADAAAGAEVSDDTLCDFLEGTLSEERERQVRDAATADPAVAARLLDLEALMRAAPPQGGEDEDAVAAAFADFQERLQSSAGEEPPSARPAGATATGRGQRRRLISWVAAASLVVVVGAALLRLPGGGGDMLAANVRPPEEAGVVRGETVVELGTRGPGPVLQLVHDDPGEVPVDGQGARWLYVEALVQARGEVCSGELIGGREEPSRSRSLEGLRVVAGKVYFALEPEIGSYRLALRCDGAATPFTYRFRVSDPGAGS